MSTCELSLYTEDGALYFKSGYLVYRLSGSYPANPTSSAVKPSFQGNYWPGNVPPVHEITGVDLSVESGKTYDYTAEVSVRGNNGLSGPGVASLSLGGTATVSSVELTFSAPGYDAEVVTDLSNAADQFELAVSADESLVLSIEGTLAVTSSGSLRPYIQVLSPNITNVLGVNGGSTWAKWLEHM